jgi:hypothetical protein
VLLSFLSILGSAFLLLEILDGLAWRVETHYQYFNEPNFPSNSTHLGANNHVEIRFAPQTAIGIEDTRLSLRNLLASFTTFMIVNDFEFWIAHGTLLGWYWNERLLPWDTDVGVQVRTSNRPNWSSSDITGQSSLGRESGKLTISSTSIPSPIQLMPPISEYYR